CQPAVFNLCYIASHEVSCFLLWLFLVLTRIRRSRDLNVPTRNVLNLPKTAGTPGGFFYAF
ncbi:MAG TPA: hypothetical protein PLN82_07745, partial [Rhodoferax sp.]|nr:hypothetical protein [Rhodoferax sp.]